MTKLLLLVVAVLLSIKSVGQVVSLGKQEIIESPNNIMKLYSNAQTWIVKSFGDYKSVVQFEDKVQGKIIIKSNSKLNIRNTPLIKFTLEIDVKDFKYRYLISDINICIAIGECNGTFYSDKRLLEVIEESKIKLDLKSSTITSSMSKKELKLYNEDLLNEKQSYELEINRKSEIVEIIERMIKSLKEDMQKDNTF